MAKSSISRNELMSILREEYNIGFVKTDDDFYGSHLLGEGTGIWLSAENRDMLPKRKAFIFDYYASDHKKYDDGVHRDFLKFLGSKGWYPEWYDGGTVFLYPEFPTRNPRKRKNKKVTRSEYARKWREMLKPYDLKVRVTSKEEVEDAYGDGSIELAIFWGYLTWAQVDTLGATARIGGESYHLPGDAVAYLLYDPSSNTSTLAVGSKGFHMYPVYSKELLKEIVRFMGVSK